MYTHIGETYKIIVGGILAVTYVSSLESEYTIDDVLKYHPFHRF
jgi:hypothetical protein